MTTKTKAPFEITKQGEAFGPDDGLDEWNQIDPDTLSEPDEVRVSLDELTGEVTVLTEEEMDPSSGAAPPGIGSYPSPQSHQSAQGPVEMPDYLSADSNANYDEDMEKCRKSLLKILETDRDREIQKGLFLRDRELYRVLEKGWDTDQKVENIVKSVKLMMSIYRDAKFLEKASQVLLAFDLSLPNTQFIRPKTFHWISKVHEIPKDRRIAFQKSASNDGHHYISGIVSDTSVDRDGDRFTYSALKEMETAINSGVTLFQNHNYEIGDSLGVPVKAELRGNEQNAELWCEFKLEDPDYNPNVKNLIHKLETGERLGFSIGGESGDTPPIRRGSGRELPSINLYEVSVVGIPSNSHSYVMGHVFKSLRPNTNPNFN